MATELPLTESIQQASRSDQRAVQIIFDATYEVAQGSPLAPCAEFAPYLARYDRVGAQVVPMSVMLKDLNGAKLFATCLQPQPLKTRGSD